MRCFKQLTQTDRVKLETLYEKKVPIKDIAKILKVHISTIYREIKHGKYYKKVGNSHKRTYSSRLQMTSTVLQLYWERSNVRI